MAHSTGSTWATGRVEERLDAPVELLRGVDHPVQEVMEEAAIHRGRIAGESVGQELALDLGRVLAGHVPLVERLDRRGAGPAPGRPRADWPQSSPGGRPCFVQRGMRRSKVTISRAAWAASAPLLPCSPPERAAAWASSSVVRTPKMTGDASVEPGGHHALGAARGHVVEVGGLPLDDGRRGRSPPRCRAPRQGRRGGERDLEGPRHPHDGRIRHPVQDQHIKRALRAAGRRTAR